MELISAVLVVAILVGCVRPGWMRSRGPFFIGATVVMLAIVLRSLPVRMVWQWNEARGLIAFIDAAVGILDAVAFILLVLSGTGLTLGQFLREVSSGLARSASGIAPADSSIAAAATGANDQPPREAPSNGG